MKKNFLHLRRTLNTVSINENQAELDLHLLMKVSKNVRN